MLRLLKIEWMKVKNYRTFWILLAITTVCIPAFNYSFYDLTNNSFPKIKGQKHSGNTLFFARCLANSSFQFELIAVHPARS